MRDSIKSEKYFDEFIAEDTARILKLTKKVNDGEVRPERLVPVKQGIFRIKLGIIIARYSRGDDIACLRSDFVEIYEEWIMSFFPLDAYNENLKMLSLAVLFEIEENLIALTKRKMKEKEVKAVEKVMKDINRPFTAIMGGSKVSSKIEIIENCLLYTSDAADE